MKKIVIVSIYILMSMIIFAHAENGVTDSVISIGTVLDADDNSPIPASGLVNGMKAYFDSVNGKGGIFGRQIKLSIKDDDYNPELTSKLMLEFTESDKVFDIFTDTVTKQVKSRYRATVFFFI